MTLETFRQLFPLSVLLQYHWQYCGRGSPYLCCYWETDTCCKEDIVTIAASTMMQLLASSHVLAIAALLLIFVAVPVVSESLLWHWQCCVMLRFVHFTKADFKAQKSTWIFSDLSSSLRIKIVHCAQGLHQKLQLSLHEVVFPKVSKNPFHNKKSY